MKNSHGRRLLGGRVVRHRNPWSEDRKGRLVMRPGSPFPWSERRSLSPVPLSVPLLPKKVVHRFAWSGGRSYLLREILKYKSGTAFPLVIRRITPKCTTCTTFFQEAYTRAHAHAHTRTRMYIFPRKSGTTGTFASFHPLTRYFAVPLLLRRWGESGTGFGDMGLFGHSVGVRRAG